MFSPQKNTKTQEGIFPDWEDEKNGPGGRWIINSDRSSSSDFDFSLLVSIRQQRGDVLDTHWLEILIFLIGEQAEVLKICTKFWPTEHCFSYKLGARSESQRSCCEFAC